MSRNKIKKRYSRSAYKAATAALAVIIIGLIATSIVLIVSINKTADEYNYYVRQSNVASSEKNMDEKTRAVFEETQQKQSLIKDLKSTVNERTTRREELKEQVKDQNSITAEAEVKMARYKEECGFSTYEELLDAYEKLLTGH